MNKSVLALLTTARTKVRQEIITHTKLLQVHVSLKKRHLRMNILVKDIVQMVHICQKEDTQNFYQKMIRFSTKIESESVVTDAELQQHWIHIILLQVSMYCMADNVLAVQEIVVR